MAKLTQDVLRCKCERCNYVFSRLIEHPTTYCPSCKSPYWNKLRGSKVIQPQSTELVYRCVCERCQYTFSNLYEKPSQRCPSCKSPYWDVPRASTSTSTTITKQKEQHDKMENESVDTILKTKKKIPI